MTGRRTAKRFSRIAVIGVGAALAGALSGYAPPARAYTFMDEVPEDPCERAFMLDPKDNGTEAQHARRACRLQGFEQRLAEERSRATASQQGARESWVQNWLEKTQTARVVHPMAIELFAGSGLVTYGVTFSWDVMSQLEVAGHLGQRQMSCADQFSGTTADCTRTTWGLGGRWFLFDKDFSPFVGTAFSSTSSSLKIVHFNMANMSNDYLNGNGRAHSLSGSLGAQLAISYLRLSLEYLYEHVFYTGANLNDPQDTPSEDLRQVWEDSLKQDRHGVRFQVGFAF